MLQWIHPTLVHFVIGLLLAGVLFDVLGLARTNEKLIFAGYWNTLLGALAAAVTVLSGLYAEAHLGPHASIGDALLGVHKMFGILVLILSVVLAAWRISMKGYILPRRRTLYLTAAFFTSAIVLVTGGFGGALVYLYGLGLPPGAAQQVINAQPKVEEKPEVSHPKAMLAPESGPPKPSAKALDAGQK